MKQIRFSKLKFWKFINHTYDKGYDTYLLHYEASKIMIEKVMNEGDIQ